MQICVVGTGYVGLVTGACLADFGMEVTCVDKDAQKIDMLQRGEMPIYEPGLEALVQRNIEAGRLHFTTDLPSAVEPALAVFIAVGTPAREEARRLSYVCMGRGFGRTCRLQGVWSPVDGAVARVADARSCPSAVRRVPYGVAPDFLRECSVLGTS